MEIDNSRSFTILRGQAGDILGTVWPPETEEGGRAKWVGVCYGKNGTGHRVRHFSTYAAAARYATTGFRPRNEGA